MGYTGQVLTLAAVDYLNIRASSSGDVRELPLPSGGLGGGPRFHGEEFIKYNQLLTLGM
jgi:hypothetical protein